MGMEYENPWCYCITAAAAAATPLRTTAAIRTAKGLVNCNVDWDGAEGAAGPCLAAVKLLDVARQSVGASRWWTMRWPRMRLALSAERAG